MTAAIITFPPQKTPLPPCPDWCTLASSASHRDTGDAIHDFAGRPDRQAREHAGPDFGPHLAVGADEYIDAAGELIFVVQLHAEEVVNYTDPDRLRELAAQVVAAAEWLEQGAGLEPSRGLPVHLRPDAALGTS